MSLLDRLDGMRHPYRWAFAASLVLAALLVHDWDGFVFERAVRDLWHGQTPYETATDPPPHAYLGPADREPQWYAYPPLPILAMALSFLPAVLLQLPPWTERVLLKLPVILGHLLLAHAASRWCRHLGRPELEARTRTVFLWNPFLLLVGPVWGMTDGGMMAFLLLAALRFDQGRPTEAGLWFAASALVKPFPVLLAIPLLAYAVAHHRAGIPRFLAAAGLAVAAVSLPFALGEPAGFWRQAVGAHLGRATQGLSLWSLPGLAAIPPSAVRVASMALLAASLAALAVAATRLREARAPLLLALGGAAAILLWNRVVNEQYLVMAVAPLLLLHQLGALEGREAWVARGAPALYAAAVALQGFHFLTFLPPDVALPLFGRPTDAVAHDLRAAAPWLWRSLFAALAWLVPLSLAALAAVAVRVLARAPREPAPKRSALPSVAASILLVALAVLPSAGHAAAGPGDAFQPAYPEARVAAFHYLWWNNPSHDPGVRYGNWDVVSQSPSLGYYTSNRGVARVHAHGMVQAGIDTAVVSYHRGELERYRTFQEEAQGAGLWVAPLIELNQLYDQPAHHPVNESGAPVTYAAYRLDEGTRRAAVAFVLDLEGTLAAPNALRVQGRPVVFFYDSYVSGVSFHDEDRRDLADVLAETQPIEELRRVFRDPGLAATGEALLPYHPATYSAFFHDPLAAPWRAAHLEQHRRFWEGLRADLEVQLGPLFLVSGDAYNERAGFEAGTVKSLVDLEAFDGAFIYSPSFTWGNNRTAPYEENFQLWEDRNRWMQGFAAGEGGWSAVGLAPSYDDTVNRPHGFTIPPWHDGVSTYDRSWASLDAVRPDLVVLATWNEHFEGSSVEATREHGTAWLDATPAWRERFAAPRPAAGSLAVVVHERESRLHGAYSEQDLPHAWGLDLAAAAARARPDLDPVVLDATMPEVGELPAPRLLLVEGGRGDYRLSGELGDRLRAWLAAGTPWILFGPDAQRGIADLRDGACPALEELEAWELRPGDRLWADGGNLRLDRGGSTRLVGAPCGPHAAFTTLKPTGADAATDAACLAVAVRALQPAAADPGPLECLVPTPGA